MHEHTASKTQDDTRQVVASFRCTPELRVGLKTHPAECAGKAVLQMTVRGLNPQLLRVPLLFRRTKPSGALTEL